MSTEQEVVPSEETKSPLDQQAPFSESEAVQLTNPRAEAERANEPEIPMPTEEEEAIFNKRDGFSMEKAFARTFERIKDSEDTNAIGTMSSWSRYFVKFRDLKDYSGQPVDSNKKYYLHEDNQPWAQRLLDTWYYDTKQMCFNATDHKGWHWQLGKRYPQDEEELWIKHVGGNWLCGYHPPQPVGDRHFDVNMGSQADSCWYFRGPEKDESGHICYEMWSLTFDSFTVPVELGDIIVPEWSLAKCGFDDKWELRLAKNPRELSGKFRVKFVPHDHIRVEDIRPDLDPPPAVWFKDLVNYRGEPITEESKYYLATDDSNWGERLLDDENDDEKICFNPKMHGGRHWYIRKFAFWSKVTLLRPSEHDVLQVKSSGRVVIQHATMAQSGAVWLFGRPTLDKHGHHVYEMWFKSGDPAPQRCGYDGNWYLFLDTRQNNFKVKFIPVSHID